MMLTQFDKNNFVKLVLSISDAIKTNPPLITVAIFNFLDFLIISFLTTSSAVSPVKNTEAVNENKQQRNIPVDIEKRLSQDVTYPSTKSTGVAVILPETSDPTITPKKKVTTRLE
jgi:hypothetical protein